MIAEGSDFDFDGNFDSVSTYEYDADNNLITVTSTSDFETNIITNSYDANHNLITSSTDQNGDGTVDTTTEYNYLLRGTNGEILARANLQLTDVHRFYQYEQGFHLYTTDPNKIDQIQQQSDRGELAYNYEAEQYQILADNKDAITGAELTGVKPVYRFFNTDTGAHLYTTESAEKDSIIDNLPNYDFEGIQYYALELNITNLETIPVYRLLNTSTGAHLYSSDTNEINHIEANLLHFVVENNGDAVFYVFEL